MYAEQLYVIIFTQFTCKPTKVRPLFTLSHIRSDNYPLLIVFSANYIDQSIVILNDFRHLQKYCTSFKICHLIGRNHDAICKYKVHLNTVSNGEFSDPLCDSVNRGLTLVRFLCDEIDVECRFWRTKSYSSVLIEMFYIPKTSINIINDVLAVNLPKILDLVMFVYFMRMFHHILLSLWSNFCSQRRLHFCHTNRTLQIWPHSFLNLKCS